MLTIQCLVQQNGVKQVLTPTRQSDNPNLKISRLGDKLSDGSLAKQALQQSTPTTCLRHVFVHASATCFWLSRLQSRRKQSKHYRVRMLYTCYANLHGAWPLSFHHAYPFAHTRPLRTKHGKELTHVPVCYDYAPIAKLHCFGPRLLGVASTDCFGPSVLRVVAHADRVGDNWATDSLKQSRVSTAACSSNLLPTPMLHLTC